MVEDTWKKELTPEKQMAVEQANENVKTGKEEVPENHIAVIDDRGNILTYSELCVYMKSVEEYIESRRIAVILADNTIGSLISYIACLDKKVVPIMLRKDMEYTQVMKYLTDYRASYCFVPVDEKCDCYMEIGKREDNRAENDFRHIGDIFDYRIYGFMERRNKKETIISKDLALLLTTSGSTGSSKVVRISYKNLRANTRDIAEYLEISGHDRAITSLPMNYTYGLSVLHTHLYKRATILLTNKGFYTKEFWDFYEVHRGTTYAGVPYSYEILKRMGFANYVIGSTHTMTVAGGKLGAKEEEYFIRYAKNHNIKFIVMYGQTEATARISYRPWDESKAHVGSIGIPIPNGKMWIEPLKENKPESGTASAYFDKDERKDFEGETKTDEAGIPGEIVYQGENVAMGYAYSYEDLSKGYEWNGVLHTGDLGYRDENGYFYVIGRKDRMVKINGIRIDLTEVEEILKEEFKLQNVRCEMAKCITDKKFNRLTIYLKKGDVKKSEVILNYISRRLGMNRRCFRIEVLDTRGGPL